MMKNIIAYFIFVLFIVEVIAERERVDSVNYNSINHGIRYDEYPMVVPKRAALLLDRIMVALQKALEDDGGPPSSKVVRPPLLVDDQAYPEYDNDQITPMDLALIKDEHLPQARLAPRDLTDSTDSRQVQQKMMGLQRRGHSSTVHPKGRIWRCYFNAITCFKK